MSRDVRFDEGKELDPNCEISDERYTGFYGPAQRKPNESASPTENVKRSQDSVPYFDDPPPNVLDLHTETLNSSSSEVQPT